jgi:hypothetical protein
MPIDRKPIDRKPMDPRRTNRPAAGLRWLCLLAMAPLTALAEPPPLPPPAAQAAVQAGQAGPVETLRARLLRHEPSGVRSLDPAIFEEISPVAATEPALRLPDDQRDEQ